MKMSFLYHQGSAPNHEDGLIDSDPFFGVLDAVSAPYAPKYPMRKFGDLSGGEFVARTVENYFRRRGFKGTHHELHDHVLGANRLVRRKQREAGVPFDAGELAGAAFAVVQLCQGFFFAQNDYYPPQIKIVQAGDCLALWVMRDGSVGITRNQVRAHDADMNAEIERHMREIAAEKYSIELEHVTKEQLGVIRGEVWNRFCEPLKEARRQDANSLESPRGYGIMNGAPGLEGFMFCKTVPRSELQALLLFSDGMVPWEAMKDMTDREVAERVYADYREGGLTHLLRVARGIEKRVENVNYMDNAEATAMALDFSDEGR